MAKSRTSKVVNASSPAANTRSSRSKLASSSSGGPSLQRMVDECADATSKPIMKNPEGGVAKERNSRFASGWDRESCNGGLAGKGQTDVNAASWTVDKGKGRAQEPSRDCFPIMKLPPEIRLEIFRACLSRPRKVLLSRVEKAPEPVAGSPTESDAAGPVSGVTSPSRSRGGPTPNPSLRRSRTTTTRSSRSHRTVFPRASSSLHAQAAASLVALSNTPYNPDTTMPNSNYLQQLTDNRHPKNNSRSPNTHSRADDALVINILRTSKQIYKEARDVLYSENTFEINIATAINTFLHLHQRSRRHIKHIELEIPTYTDILERFSDIVRLSLRYCTGLKKLVLQTPFTLPGHENGIGSATNTGVYANGFDILRWLPQQCEVVLKGHSNPDIDKVVAKHMNLAKTQDKMAYARRQLISNESDRLHYIG